MTILVVFAALNAVSMVSGELPALHHDHTRLRAPIEWRESTPIGTPSAGRLEGGVQLPAEGRHFFTWDPIKKRTPNRGWRRWGTDDTVRTTLRVLRDFAADHPNAPRIGVGDISRPHGGDFGDAFGRPGHVSHQNGLDVDVYYPRKDGEERRASEVEQIDLRLAQNLVDRFARAGATHVFVGLNTPLSGPSPIVSPYFRHDDHLHVRFG